MDCIDLTSKQSKMLRYVAKHSKQRKPTKVIKLQWIASIWHQNDQKHWGTVAKHSKQRKTTKLIKLQWTASIWHQNNQKCWDTSQNIQNNAKLRKWSNYSALHRFDVKTIRNVQWRRKYWKQCKTTKLIKVQRIASIWCQNDQNNSKLQTRSNYDQFASIWHQNNPKCWDTSQNIQNNANQRKWSNYNALHRFDV